MGNWVVTGFVKGLGQGLVGVAAQPVSGALDFMSSAFEGIDASSNVIMGKLSNHRAVKRRRLPRAIGGDRKLQPFLRLDGTDTQARSASLFACSLTAPLEMCFSPNACCCLLSRCSPQQNLFRHF